LTEVGYNTIITSGHLNISGAIRNDTWTRMTQSVSKGDFKIAVVDGSIFKVGDTIVVTSSEFKIDHHEEHNVTNINGNVLTLQATLKYHHYGNNTSFETKAGDIDLRAMVFPLERNVKISCKV